MGAIQRADPVLDGLTDPDAPDQAPAVKDGPSKSRAESAYEGIAARVSALTLGQAGDLAIRVARTPDPAMQFFLGCLVRELHSHVGPAARQPAPVPGPRATS